MRLAILKELVSILKLHFRNFSVSILEKSPFGVCDPFYLTKLVKNVNCNGMVVLAIACKMQAIQY